MNFIVNLSKTRDASKFPRKNTCYFLKVFLVFLLGVTCPLEQSVLLSERFHSYKQRASSDNVLFACIYLAQKNISITKSFFTDREWNPQHGLNTYAFTAVAKCYTILRNISDILVGDAKLMLFPTTLFSSSWDDSQNRLKYRIASRLIRSSDRHLTYRREQRCRKW